MSQMNTTHQGTLGERRYLRLPLISDESFRSMPWLLLFILINDTLVTVGHPNRGGTT